VKIAAYDSAILKLKTVITAQAHTQTHLNVQLDNKKKSKSRKKKKKITIISSTEAQLLLQFCFALNGSPFRELERREWFLTVWKTEPMRNEKNPNPDKLSCGG